MTRATAIPLLIVLGGAFAFFTSVVLLRSSDRGTTNYRGKPVPAVLGIALAAAIFAATLVVFSVVLWTHTPGRPEVIRREALLILVACLVVFLGGLYDDRVGGPARGLVAHFRALFEGRVTSGIVKLVAALVAAALVAWAYRPSLLVAVLGVGVMAGAADLWNLLDVRPGRALKYFIPVCLVLLIVSLDTQYALVAPAALGAVAAVFFFDLTERAMLGDAGSNLLGFVIGVGLFESLPLWALVLAFLAILALHWASEAVTLSRMIESTPPLRWYDRLGRVGEEPREDPKRGESGGRW